MSDPSGRPPVTSSDAASRTGGLIAGVGAYLIWGFIAGFFKLLTDRGVPSMTLLAHRVVWSMLFCVLLLIMVRSTSDFWNVCRDRRRVGMLALSSLMIAINWLTFIYSVETDQLAQSALGYFMTPLISVVLALVVLRERLRPMQWVSVGLAAAGVAIILQGELPWIALSVALSFGFYGLIRKTTQVLPMTGLAVETAILTPAAVGYIAYASATPGPAEGFPAATYGLLMLAGVITAIPLLLFAQAARTLKLSTVGFLQYVAPSLQLLLALLVYEETLPPTTLAGFVPIWIGLILFSTDAAITSRRPRPT